MNKRLKYVVFKFDEQHGNEEVIFMWPDRPDFIHQDMSEIVGRYRYRGTSGYSPQWGALFLYGDFVSAGFCTVAGGCYGRSESMDLDSRPEQDTKLMKEYLGLQ